MADEHWFDALNKALVRGTPRRRVLRTSAMVGLGLAIATAPTVAAAKKGKGKRKQKGKSKQKPNPKPPPSCSGGACAQQWADDQDEIDHCEFICRQCDGPDTRQFCIVEGDPTNPTKVAVCCTDGAACCGDECCGGIDNPELKCCEDGCTYTKNDVSNCGDCGNACPLGQSCIDGQCDCATGYKYCPLATRCVDDRAECCGGLPLGYCFPPFPCCGSGADAYCHNQLMCP